MSGNRLELKVTVFEESDQVAQVLPELKPAQLIGAILKEFSNLEYLGNQEAEYRLLRAATGTPLEPGVPLRDQVKQGDQLILVEAEPPLPSGAQRPSHPIYLREQRTSRAYKLPWQPAIVGRVSVDQPLNEWVAVDLSTHPTGLRASRRHVQITEQGGAYFVENISRNPATLVRDGQEVPLEHEHPYPLRPGDVIRLDRGDINLKFIQRDG